MRREATNHRPTGPQRHHYPEEDPGPCREDGPWHPNDEPQGGEEMFLHPGSIYGHICDAVISVSRWLVSIIALS